LVAETVLRLSIFHIPDLRGRFLRGVDDGAGNDPDSGSRTAMNSGGNTGDSVGSIQDDANKSHYHFEFYDANPTTVALTSTNYPADKGLNGSSDARSTFVSGQANVPDKGRSSSEGASDARPKNAYVNYLIKI
jgi:hypothetical protein